METNAARTTAIRLINNSQANFRLARVTLGDNAKFRGEEPRPGLGLSSHSMLYWELEWNGAKVAGEPKPTELEFGGSYTLTVSMREGEWPRVIGVQAEVQPGRQPGGFEITIR